MHTINGRGITVHVGPIIVVNEGASNGPRVASASFECWSGWRGPRHTVRVVVDVDAREYQDEGAIRRRGARAAVPVAKRAATAIASETSSPALALKSKDPPWGNAVWSISEAYEGFQRRVIASADFRLVDGEELALPTAVRNQVSADLTALSITLHTALEDPANWPIFGGRDAKMAGAGGG